MLCYIDAFSGISGDMLVGALADAGASQTAISEALAPLAPMPRSAGPAWTAAVFKPPNSMSLRQRSRSTGTFPAFLK